MRVSQDQPTDRRTTPVWALLLVLAVPALGVASIARGEVVVGIIWVAAIPAAWVVGRVLRRNGTRSADADAPAGVERALAHWAVGVGGFGALVVIAAVAAILQGLPSGLSGVPALFLGMFALLLAGRIVLSIRTVGQLEVLTERYGLGTLVVVVAKDAGVRGYARRPVVIAIDDSRLAIARASAGDAAWQVLPLTSLAKAEVRITGPGGEIEVANGGFDVHLTGIQARPLRRMEAILSAAGSSGQAERR
jgi:hypothetical protein